MYLKPSKTHILMPLLLIIHLVLQSRFWDTLLNFPVIFPQNGTAVLKGLIAGVWAMSNHKLFFYCAWRAKRVRPPNYHLFCLSYIGNTSPTSTCRAADSRGHRASFCFATQRSVAPRAFFLAPPPPRCHLWNPSTIHAEPLVAVGTKLFWCVKPDTTSTRGRADELPSESTRCCNRTAVTIKNTNNVVHRHHNDWSPWYKTLKK